MMKSHGFAINDDSRLVKAQKIIACLEYLDENLQNSKVLDVGCSSGLISCEIAKRTKSMIALDITDKVLKDAMQERGFKELAFGFIIGDSMSLPFQDSCVDIVVCNQVFEHVLDQQKLVTEISRVLRPKGLCYIATGNRLWPIEPHTKLPVLSYLPKSLADKYVLLVGLDKYDVRLPTYWTLKRILGNEFEKVLDFTPLIIKNAQRFHIKDEIPVPLVPILKRVPLALLKILSPLSPGWVMVAIKSL